MTDHPPLSTYADLHRRAIAAGMRGVLPDGYRIMVSGDGTQAALYGRIMIRVGSWRLKPVPDTAALASCREWLRDFCRSAPDIAPEEVLEWELDEGLIALADHLIKQEENALPKPR